MLCLSVMPLKLFLFQKKPEKPKSKDKRLSAWRERLSPVWKEILGILSMFFCPLPLFLFALTRLLKLIVQFINPGQTICTQNYLNLEKPPLGKNLNFSIILY